MTYAAAKLMRSVQMTTQSTEAKSETTAEGAVKALLVVGADADWDAAAAAAKGADTVAYYSLEGAWKAHGLPIPYGDVIDITEENPTIETTAWEWTTDLTRTLEACGDYCSSDVLEVMRRGFFAHQFKPIGMARARAARVKDAYPDVESITAIGVSDIEHLALRELFGDATTLSPIAAPQVASPVQTSAVGRMRRLLHKSRSLVRLVVTNARSRRADRKLMRPLRALACSRNRPCALVMAKNEQHMRALSSTLRELRSRGWRLTLFVPPEGVTLSEYSIGQFEATANIAELANPDSLREEFRSRTKSRDSARQLIIQWAHSADLALFAATLAELTERRSVRMRRSISALDTTVRALRPQVILTTNETHYLVEGAAVVGRRRGTPTVNVQHGIIADTPLRADFRFDAFCVYGDAYADTLNALGTTRDRIRVVGNPFLDGRDQADVGSRDSENETAPRADTEPGGCRVLFAAQHHNFNLSDMLLYATLAPVLQYAARAPECELIVKLHPLGHGKELGYELALSEYPAANVTVVRSGDLHNMIEAADCVATYSSTVAFDAPAMSRPVVVVDPFETSWLAPLVGDGVALSASNADEFSECVRQIIEGQMPFDAHVSAFNRRYGSLSDGLAGSRIADVCEELAGL